MLSGLRKVGLPLTPSAGASPLHSQSHLDRSWGRHAHLYLFTLTEAPPSLSQPSTPPRAAPAGRSLAGGAAAEAENWPLVQAFGLEGVGRPGFFTMTFEVADAWAPLREVYLRLDGRALEQVLTQALPRLCHAWEEVTSALDKRACSERALLTERAVGEPLLALFAYSTLKAVATAGAVRPQEHPMLPRVSFGTRTGGTVIDVGQASAVRMSEAREGGRPALHFVVEGADPKTALRAARTFFFSQGGGVTGGHAQTLALPSLVEDEDPPYEPQPSDSDVQAMAALYLALAEGCRAGVRAFCARGGSSEKARAAAINTLVQVATARGAAPLLSTVSGERPILVEVWGDDGSGGVTPDPRRGERVLKVMRVSVVGLKCVVCAALSPLIASSHHSFMCCCAVLCDMHLCSLRTVPGVE